MTLLRSWNPALLMVDLGSLSGNVLPQNIFEPTHHGLFFLLESQSLFMDIHFDLDVVSLSVDHLLNLNMVRFFILCKSILEVIHEHRIFLKIFVLYILRVTTVNWLLYHLLSSIILKIFKNLPNRLITNILNFCIYSI